MNKFWNLIDGMSKWLKVPGAACLIGMTLLTCADVIGRLFRHPIFGSEEIVGFMATITVAMALPYTDHIKGHVGVEILVRLLSEKTQIIIDICTRIISFVLFSLVVWQMFSYGETMRKSGELSMSLQLPEYIVIFITAFSFLVFALVIAKDILLKLKQLKG